jgi:predicted MFS family arabinose efflux permease
LTVRGMLRSSRVLQIALLVALAANLGSGVASEVALPALAHGPLHTGAAGYGGLIAAFGAGALLGTVVSGHAGRARRPAISASVVFLIEALFMAAVPYLGSAFGAGAALVVWGAMNGFGNVVMITAWQHWAPPELLGRLTGLVMTATFGIFPVSVLLGGVVVHNLGPAAFFPIGAAPLAVAILFGLTQRSWRGFGTIPVQPPSMADSAAPVA